MKKLLNKTLQKLCRTIEEHAHVLTLNCRRVKLPYLSGIIGGVSEPWMNSVLSKLFKNTPGTFIDVGVNLGQTLLHVKTLNPDRPYIGFEPNPDCCFYVNRLIEYNNFSEATLVPVGLADRSGLGVLHFIQDCCHDSAGSIVEGFRDASRIQRKVFVPLYDLKDSASVLPVENIGIIKIDVEGAESLVLKALWRTIEAQRPIIVLEMLPPGDDTTDRFIQQHSIYTNFRDINYSLCRIVKKIDNTVTFEVLDRYIPYSEIDLSDYVAIPNERREDFI